MTGQRVLGVLVLSLTGVFASNAIMAQQVEQDRYMAERVAECGSLFNSVGPFDYRTRHSSAQRDWDDQDTTRNHYDPAYQRIKEREFSERVMADIDFLLRAYPNHYPALQLLIEYDAGGGWPHRFRSPDCYFERARRFQPDDLTVIMYEAYYWLKKGDRERAARAYQDALVLQPDSADANYNYGLLLANEGDYERALGYAQKAYAAGYPLAGLRRKLEKAGKWRPLEQQAGELSPEAGTGRP
ncbi:MAG: tetratricopeptide repeat protein [Gammaproteobacteria bacterium]|nr:tetratricopeptide repeat protein [Gammaproteobacteria bacterium]